MSSVGLIFRASAGLDTLPDDWTPCALGERNVVELVVKRALASANGELSLNLTIENDQDSAEPRTISALGVWGAKECAVLQMICTELSARFYDAESGTFISMKV